MTMAFNEEENFQMTWINSHPIIDKDSEQKSTKRWTRTKRTNSKKIKKFLQDKPFGEPEQEIDLHGCEGLEAVEKVDSLIHAMIPAGYKLLRIIHGGGIEDWLNNYPKAMFDYKSSNMILSSI